MTIQEYVDQLNTRYRSGISREHSYRGDLQNLLGSLLPELLVTNEPTRSDVGAPDYILTKGKIPIGYIEAKDIGDSDLKGKKKHKDQFERYKTGLPNLIFTDYLDFHLYREGEFVSSIRIAEIRDGNIVGLSKNYDAFENLIKEFGTHVGQTIRSSSKLSKMMAGKARLLADIIEKSLNADEKEQQNRVNESANNTLREQLAAFQNVLIHDIKAKEFADIYAQTIAYGMFAARLHDPTLDTFSRHEAAELIPKTNPFLRKLFHYIAGYDLDDRISWVVDGLADIFRATDVDGLLKNFGKATQQQDPIIHFYETFLAEYDPKLRKSRGVWYTPEPVVNFIVRAVDDILKDEFGLKDGLADTSKTKVKVNTDIKNKNSSTGYKQVEREVHKVQILDPAAGTGTFLAEVIRQIYKRFEGQQGIWKTYVDEHLIPRLNGFEILMASYAMAHLKLDLLLRETGVEPSGNERFRVYLTNSLEEHHPDTGTLFANWLSQEANEANHIKRDTPVMVVLGNPPYSVSSSNKSDWIEELMHDYKKDLNERNIQPLSDDYLKFIRFGEYYIEKNGEGVLAYISNNSFIDGLIHKKVREHLLGTFDDIYILDLHGSTKRKETAPDGSKDENVFDILPGVSINLFIKKTYNRKQKAKLRKFDLFGDRTSKYKFLSNKDLSEIKWEKVQQFDEQFSFKPFSPSDLTQSNSFKLDDLFKKSASGITTERDNLTIQFSKQIFTKIQDDLINLEENKLRHKYEIGKDGRDWKLETAKEDLKNNPAQLIEVLYRPFDIRHTLYTGNSKGFHSYPRSNIMDNLVKLDNQALIVGRQGQAMGDGEWNIVSISNKAVDCNIYYRGRGTVFPIYLYPEESTQQTLDGQPERTPNLDKKIIKEITEKLGLKFTSEKEDTDGTFAPIDLLDYIYAVLHSPSYREKYKEFLKIDFPRVPYPEDQKTFRELVELGSQLRNIHLLEHPVVDEFITTYPVSGSNVISNRLTKTDPGFIPDEESGPGKEVSHRGESREAGGVSDQARDAKNDDSGSNQDSVIADSDPQSPSSDEAAIIGKVWINDQQYFGNVPKVAWEFYIGGYQPAEKWLKDRRDRELSFEEIQHYQKIIVALMETGRVMGEIDGVFDINT